MLLFLKSSPYEPVWAVQNLQVEICCPTSTLFFLSIEIFLESSEIQNMRIKFVKETSKILKNIFQMKKFRKKLNFLVHCETCVELAVGEWKSLLAYTRVLNQTHKIWMLMYSILAFHWIWIYSPICMILYRSNLIEIFEYCFSKKYWKKENYTFPSTQAPAQPIFPHIFCMNIDFCFC